jgi:hypothetical protein
MIARVHSPYAKSLSPLRLTMGQMLVRIENPQRPVNSVEIVAELFEALLSARRRLKSRRVYPAGR